KIAAVNCPYAQSPRDWRASETTGFPVCPDSSYPMPSVTSDHRRHALRIHQRGRMDIESISDAHQHVEERPVVHRLSDLRLAPAPVAQALHLFVGNAVGMAGQGADKFQQQTFCGGDRCTV